MRCWLGTCWLVWAGCSEEVYCDRDRDGYGGPIRDCPDGALVSEIDGEDCDDSDPDVLGRGDEICDNGIDDDCDGLVDETSEPLEPSFPPHYQDNDGDGFGDPRTERWCVGEGVPSGSDCDDSDPEVHPSRPEIPDNGIDDDCDGLVDAAGTFSADDILVDCSASAGEVTPPAEVSLEAHAEDPLGQALSYEWSVVEAPPTSLAEAWVFGPSGSEVVPIDLAGDYGFEVIASATDGRRSAPCLVEIVAAPSEDLWVELVWTEIGDDLDLHLVAPGGELEDNLLDCHYSNCVPPLRLDWGIEDDPDDDPQLALDDIDDTGPENIRLARPADGTYRVVVHDFEGLGDPTGSNPATVNVYLGGALAWTATFDVLGEDQYYEIVDISFPDRTVAPLIGSLP